MTGIPRKLIRSVVETILPVPVFSRVQSIRSRNHARRFLQSEGLLKLGRDFTARYGRQVLHGPFAGMKYTPEAIEGRHAVPKLLGSYELELHPVIEAVGGNEYENIIDIGSAEGYYAVGLARITCAQIHAFDPEPRERRLCHGMAVLNGVGDRIRIGSWCSSEVLAKICRGKTFILSDCEGYESVLFDERTIEQISSADLLIEVHDILAPDVSGVLADRFQRTHTVRRIAAMQRCAADFSELSFLIPWQDRAISEYRTAGSEWLLLRSRSSETATTPRRK